MYIACLWSHWTDPKEPDLRGFAAFTDEPPADVAAGVTAASTADLQSMLSDRAIPVFQHEVLKAA
jgi:putative SOS response-associated peptidase YedK